jgi:Xaa-Pro dipeptidase
MPEDTRNVYTIRQRRLSAALQSAGVDALALNPGPSLTYLTGLSFHLMERPVVALFMPQVVPHIVLPELEGAKLADLSYPMRPFTYGEDPTTWLAVFRSSMNSAGLSAAKVGVEPRRLRYLELSLLEGAAQRAGFVSAEETIASLRVIKDLSELDAMRHAVRIAQDALLATIPMIKAGVAEKQIAAELTVQLLRHGSDPEMPFAPIVSGGPNSANPHASPSDRPLQPGDLLVIDWGASFQGYISDITRTFAIPPVDPELDHIARVVAQANEAGRLACAPEITAGDVDHAARQVIEDAGYGRYFTHRTGHGIGMEGHEDPYIRAGSNLPLQPGMTFTVEPGIYLPGLNGVRIEDNMVITPTGAESLTDLPRDLVFLG